MWTQRDQVQAYQFLRRRAVSALQFGDANSPVAPGRRVGLGTVVGLGCALLVAGVFGVHGFLRPSGGDRSRPGQVVIEKETGAAFVLGSDGALHPMLNYASARLLAGGSAPTVVLSRRALAGAARGVPLGIPGAPASLPAADTLVGAGWAVCSRPPDAPGGARKDLTTTVLIGVRPAGTPLAADRALIVRDAQGTRYAVIDGVRHRIRGAAAVAVGYDAAPATQVEPAWLNAVPAGPDLAVIAVPGSGASGPRVGARDTRVGQVLAVATVGAGTRFYLVVTAGLAPVSQTEAALVLAAATARAAYPDAQPRPVVVSAADVAAAGPVAAAPATGLPARTPPATDPAGATACAVVDTGGTASIQLAGGDPLPAGARAVPVRGSGSQLADAVYLPPGTGALLVARPAPQAPGGTRYFVSDQGIRFPVPGDTEQAALGYGGRAPVPVAAPLLQALPAGPALASTAAQQVATG
jgi:type VII secretion protein EccB